LVLVAVGAAAVGGASCGGRIGEPRDGSREGGHDGSVDSSDAAVCPTGETLVGEPPPQEVVLDGGVPLDQIINAFAVARCDYLTRCFGLSTYYANNCVQQVKTFGSFSYPPSGATIGYPDPSQTLLTAVANGVVRYDAQQAAACIAALLVQGCAAYQLIEAIPACAGVFTCAPGTDGGTGGAAADGGATCQGLISGYNRPVATCQTDQDCAGVPARYQGPDCVFGICAPSRCGITSVAGCTSFALPGEPCASNAFSVLNATVAAAAMCQPGLNCKGATPAGGLGTCVIPADVYGTCTDNANCKPGLACACGICEIPPYKGPCVNRLCQLGAAFCEPATNTCHPIRLTGESCADSSNACVPGLFCDPDLLICQSAR
jgi:hypothetical protein